MTIRIAPPARQESCCLFAALEKLVSREAIGPWLKEPNPAFDGSSPLQVIERGEIDRIWRMLHELESGEPT